jgi:hypothetical protein
MPNTTTDELRPGAEQLAAFLDAVRWSAVTSADVKTLQAPFRSGVAIEDYQREPVARAVEAPRVNLLLADDVGLGKTVDAGLVAQELLLRHRTQHIMVVCPAGLTLKWRDEMAEKFGLDFTIIDSDRCAQVRRDYGSAANPFSIPAGHRQPDLAARSEGAAAAGRGAASRWPGVSAHVRPADSR